MNKVLGLLFVLLLAIPSFAANPSLPKGVGLDTLFSSQSTAASFNSSDIEVQNNVAMAIQVVTATCTSCDGSYKLQATNVRTPVSTDWTDLDGTAVTVNATNYTSPVMWNLNNPGYYKVRVAYTRTGGSGTINGNVVVKAFGGK